MSTADDWSRVCGVDWLAEEVEVDFGAGARRLARWTPVLDLTADRGLVPADGPVDWSPLDAFADCRTVRWSGSGRGIIDAVAARPGIRFLYWHDAVGDAAGEVDLSATNLGTVRLDGVGLRTIRLPLSIETLHLIRPSPALRVQARELGRGLDLRLVYDDAEVVIPAGVRRASTVWLSVSGTVSAAVLADLTELEELRVTFDEPPGVLTDLFLLGRHHRLHSLQLGQAYGLNPDELPDLPQLRYLELNGTRRSTAAALRARFKTGPVELSITGAKTQTWLAKHMDNPFRDWVEDSTAFGQAACAAYTRAWQAIEAIASGEPDAPDHRDAAERALRALVTDLNTIDGIHGSIDTDRREHVWAVVCDLAARAHIPRSQASAWFDQDRRF